MRVYIELTNPIHGGEGWELGEVLWSPVGQAWNNIMIKPQRGDLVIHSIKQLNPRVNHKFWGYSIVSDNAMITKEKPSLPDRWENYEEYYVIPLNNYIPFIEKRFTQDFLNKYGNSLSKLNKENHQFYSTTEPPKVVQSYLTVVPEAVQVMLEEYLDIELISANLSEVARVSEEETIASTDGNGKPTRVKTVVERIVRNTSIIKQLKTDTNNKCQVCGSRLLIGDGKYYSEGHHLKKLGSIHQGPDVVGNVIILCPNHHVEFDLGTIAINLKTMRLVHMDPNNPIHNKPLAYNRNNLDMEYIKYHYENLYKGKN